MAEISKQDLQNIIENAKNRIIDRTLTRQDMLTISDTTRDRIIGSIGDMVQSCHQQMYSRENILHNQTQRYISGLESRMMTMEAEIKSMKRLMIQMLDKLDAHRKTTVTLQPEQQATGSNSAYTKYTYQTN